MPRTNRILIRSGTTTPSASDFATNEPAFDRTAGILYIKNAAGSMVAIGPGGGGGGSYTLPAATTTALGGVIVGDGLAVTAGGTVSQRLGGYASNVLFG